MRRPWARARRPAAASDRVIFSGWRQEHGDLWGQHPVCIEHALAETGLFTDEALAALIDVYPRENYDLLHMAEQGTGHLATWREGDLGGTPGAAALQAIQQGRMWINLRRVHESSAPHARLLDDIFGELEGRIPGLRTFKHNFGILISSPRAQVYYHSDLPGQSLWQIRGNKRVFVYPNYPPFLPEAQLEGIVLNMTEAEIDYQPWFEDYAQVFELEPGQMLNWPLNAPHRVENGDCVNISVTTEHWTPHFRDLYAVRYANGLIRTRLGVTPPPPDTRGARFWARAALAAGVKTSGMMSRYKHPKRIEWHLDPDADGLMREVAPYDI
jgi:hypothetical protein